MFLLSNNLCLHKKKKKEEEDFPRLATSILPDFPISIHLLVQLAEHGQWSSSREKNNTYSQREY
jgi:hypothetical protein